MESPEHLAEQAKTLASWRAMGDSAAFSPQAWEMQARHFYEGAKLLRAHAPQHGKPETVTGETISCLVVAAFNAALALELLVKAIFLANAPNQPRRVYTHHVAELLPEHLLAPAQRELLQRAVRRVRWSGRYPTPMWTSEGSRRDWDVKVLEDGSIDGGSIPNSTGIDEVAALIELFEALWPSYTAPPDATPAGDTKRS